MRKTWLVARHEYMRHVSRKGFLFAILSLPLLIGLIIGVVFVVSIFQDDKELSIGYVDQSGLLVLPDSIRAGMALTAHPVAFSTEEEAREALEAGRLEAYFLVADDYIETNSVTLVHNGDVGDTASNRFRSFLRKTLLGYKSADIQQRALSGTSITIRSPDGSRVFSTDPTFGQIAPLFSGFALMFLLFISAAYLTEAVVEEKQNRTMEILVITMSPDQLITGKVLGIVASTFTQIAAWFLMLVLFVFSAGFYGLLWFQNISVDLSLIAFVLVLTVFVYIIFAALMVTIGSTITDGQGSQQIAALLISALFLLLSAFPAILENPNGPLAIGLSLFPLSSPLVIPMRAIVIHIPVWQLLLTLFIAVLGTIGALWMAGRAFRMGMLRYGQRMKWKELFQKG